MLAKFSVSNFKGFKTEFQFDLTQVNGYAFNKESIKNGLVNNALVYGHNGVGKSNLGLAIFDIISHLTEKECNRGLYHNYLNALSREKTAKFSYQFLINGVTVQYDYEKENLGKLIVESFSINEVEYASIDFRVSNKAKIRFKGAETLHSEITNRNLSLLRYIKNNSQLEKNNENSIFFQFFEYLESMLFFRSLDHNMYLGLEFGARGIEEDIIERGNVSQLEEFLNIAGIECELKVVKKIENEVIAFDFGDSIIPFYEIASTGTKSLTLFFYWLQRLKDDKNVQFVFIDEFDAFYHHELSAVIVEELKKSGVQFILTSHNTSIITNELLRPDCYFLMKKDSIRSLSNSTPKELREAHNIEKMYKAGSFYAE